VYIFCPAIKSITVEKGNPVYHSSGNCLIKTETKTLVVGCQNSVIPTDGSVEIIGDCAFYGCSFLESISIPEGVESINYSAFSGCSSLKTVVFSGTVKKIGDYAFSKCVALEKVHFSKSIETLGRNVFSHCKSVMSLTVEEGNTTFHSNGNCIIETAKKTLVLGCNRSFIPTDGSVTAIGESAFEGRSLLANITIPQPVTVIDGSAFKGCSALTSVSLPNSLVTIEKCAFEECSSLSSITIPESVKTIGKLAFNKCQSLTYVYFTNKNGWTVKATGSPQKSVDVTSSTQTAEFLKKTYITSEWKTN
jgi:hypothetical protein